MAERDDPPDALPVPIRPPAPTRAPRPLSVALWLALGWTAAVGLSLATALTRLDETTLALARTQAETAWQKESAYWHWNARHGGVYVPATDLTPPNPYLAGTPERDITTPSGRHLTLVNPGYMARQAAEASVDPALPRTHVTAQAPTRPENAPDRWERRALEALRRGAPEVLAVQEANGGDARLRLLRPLPLSADCLGCHAQEGYRAGQMNGALSVAVPLPPLRADAAGERLALYAGHAGAWLLGLMALGLAGLRLQRRMQAWSLSLRVASAEQVEAEERATHARQALAEATEALAQEQETHRAQAARLHLLETALEQVPVAVMITDPIGSIEYANPKLCDVTGYPRSELIGQNPRLFKAEDTPRETYRELWDTLLAGQPWQGELFNRTREGELFWVRELVTPIETPEGDIGHFLAVLEDDSVCSQEEASVRLLAYYDPLTHLPNRREMRKRLDLKGSAVAAGKAKGFALILVDIDHFKDVNARHGTELGDKLLHTLGERLRHAVRSRDVVARLGSDEFALLIVDVVQEDHVSAVAAKVHRTLTAPINLSGVNLRITASIGISLFPADAGDVDTLFKNADIARYRAQRLGRNNFQFYAPNLAALSHDRLAMQQALERALEDGDFLLQYQPRLRLDGDRVTGVEALLRLRHPELGLIPPQRFMAVAEASGLIVPIGEWGLRAACRQNLAWQALGLSPMPVCVNLSARQLAQPDLAARIEKALHDTGLAPRWLELELAEEAVLANQTTAVETLTELKRLGVRLALDDFGAGLFSLRLLGDLPLDALKIDQSFVRAINAHPGREKVTAAIINLAHNLDLEVIAEGVETREQLELLRRHGCNLVQGFVITHPLSAEGVELMLRSHRLPLFSGGQTPTSGD
jgi:diguanylate cyclase (GGDEF)-like protein/PAS domain S-box-containing protein